MNVEQPIQESSAASVESLSHSHRQAGPVSAEPSIQESSAASAESRHRQQTGLVNVELLTVVSSAATVENHVRNGEEKACQLSVLNVRTVMES